jgi:hypothetical protein
MLTISKILTAIAYLACLMIFIFVISTINNSDIGVCLSKAFSFYGNFAGLGALVLLIGMVISLAAIKKEIPWYVFPIPLFIFIGMFKYYSNFGDRYYSNHCEGLNGDSCVQCVQK